MEAKEIGRQNTGIQCMRQGNKNYTYEEKKLALKTFFSKRQSGCGMSLREFSGVCQINFYTLRDWVRKISWDLSNIDKLKGCPRNRAIRSKITSLAEPVQELILKLKAQNPSWGPLKLKQYLFRHEQVLIPQTSIYRFLKARGLVNERQPASKESGHTRSFEYPYPLAAVQMDLMSVTLSSGARIYLVTLLDDFSRFVLAARFIAVKTMSEVIEVLRETIAEHGVMDKLLTDHGSEFMSWQRFTRFEELLVDLDVEYIASGPNKKENQGKVERWHQTLRQLLRERGPLDFSSEAHLWIGRVVDYYNYERPHQALGGLVPADRFFGVHEELGRELKRSQTKSGQRIYLACRLGDRKIVLSGSRADQLSLLVDGSRVLDAAQLENTASAQYGEQAKASGPLSASPETVEEKLPLPNPQRPKPETRMANNDY
jgi:transposase InsO family protein